MPPREPVVQEHRDEHGVRERDLQADLADLDPPPPFLRSDVDHLLPGRPPALLDVRGGKFGGRGRHVQHGDGPHEGLALGEPEQSQVRSHPRERTVVVEVRGGRAFDHVGALRDGCARGVGVDGALGDVGAQREPIRRVAGGRGPERTRGGGSDRGEGRSPERRRRGEN
eukprot:CAMPEP_0183310478 /NCGR_PEP_ID=MMETSP0160_2-20130417/31626_1 /TAXON_ID=2839 ORGANISM="Odontella Sinensis, Strain Grunow 1884" /NCGR_SAMPLE_ID=MMETSP0160_2 /ASSEMBLY_ACC=CAM_ASM_000250 /LENGTH=168 /DNA_ID=CAMNT_0025474743 /DNA_START=159 /DNA_END=662 /DNA_ORIENTATION=+